MALRRRGVAAAMAAAVAAVAVAAAAAAVNLLSRDYQKQNILAFCLLIYFTVYFLNY